MVKTQPRKVDPFKFGQDFQTALLAEFGFSTRKIIKDTGLTPAQVSYRLKKFGIKRRDYRDGDSIGAQTVMRVAQREASKPVAAALHERLGVSR